MTTVYVTRYEDMNAFSTARKAIESVLGQGWEIYTNKTNDPLKGKSWALTEKTVSKAIAQLNTEGFLSLYSEGESMEIARLNLN